MTSDEHALPDKLSRELWLLIVTLIIIQITVTFTSLTLAVSAPSVASAYGISTEFIGYQISLIYVAAAMTATTADYQLNRWGAIRISQISLLFSAVGAVFMVLPSLWFIILGSLLIGVGYGMTNPAASQVLMGSTPPHYRNIVFSLKQTGVPAGGICAGLIVPAINQYAYWQAAPLLGAVVCFLLIVLVQPMRRRWETPINVNVRLNLESFRGLKLCLTNRNLFWLSLVGLFFGGVQLCLVTFTVAMLVSQIGFTLIAAGAVLAALQMAGVTGRVVFGYAADKIISGQQALIFMSVINVAGALTIFYLDAGWPVWLIYLTFITFGSCALGWNGIIQAEAVSNAPLNHSGAVIGALSVPMFGGVIMGPAVFALLVSFTQSYTDAFLLLVLFASASLACLLMLDPRQKPDE